MILGPSKVKLVEIYLIKGGRPTNKQEVPEDLRLVAHLVLHRASLENLDPLVLHFASLGDLDRLLYLYLHASPYHDSICLLHLGLTLQRKCLWKLFVTAGLWVFEKMEPRTLKVNKHERVYSDVAKHTAKFCDADVFLLR